MTRRRINLEGADRGRDMKGAWLNQPPADALPGDWLSVRLRARRWQICIFPVKLDGKSRDGNWAYHTAGGRTFLTEESVHEFWSVVFRRPH